MAHLIDKDALVAEIERLFNEHSTKEYCDEAGVVLNQLEDFLDTLEVKEVDLEKDYEEFVVDDPILGHFITNDTMGMELAKHFFELGVNTSNPLTWEDMKLIWTIGDEIPYMPEEDFFKELLKRFEAQKGEKV